ncbi:membrane transport protein-domain-containing protein [Clohesyomyces aquaticus]|uniref:Membrane transport protein-domain-containing protein n=1 Tax=Clohesyomyces aquaticus TaxID=1231657 RepID=A0A1Y1ZKC3_9PLEO|nr:membrane transport protein-domain-containing protein [Clohesyomyces aquaticus]
MGLNGSELLAPFLGAIQASFSVLLTIFFGVLTGQFGLLSSNAAKEVSRTCVRMFLPALLIYEIGSELDQETGVRYVPILVWSVSYTLLSMAIGSVATRFFKMPAWVTPAITFNNTTSLPLLLIQSLDATGILRSILKNGDSGSEAIDRAKSFFLVNAMISNSLTFALGPRLLRPHDEDTADNKDEDDDDQEDAGDGTNGDIEGGQGQDGGEEQEEFLDEETSLLPQGMIRRANRAERGGFRKGRHYWSRLPPWAQEVLDIMYLFVNAPLLGALVGAIIGLTPPLHRLFFNDSNKGGYFNAWLTTSIKNIGELFASMQIIVVGVKLSQSLRKMKKGEDSGSVPWKSMVFITLVRFFLWPLISIPIVWALATKTSLLDSDPILWFAMMLMPTGPPAMILVPLSDVNGSPEAEKMAIAKLLTISYSITPLICFAVVGSLKASEAAMAK